MECHPSQVSTVVAVLIFLIAGPLFLIGKAMERRAARTPKTCQWWWTATLPTGQQRTGRAPARFLRKR